jgi:hypothetical protein
MRRRPLYLVLGVVSKYTRIKLRIHKLDGLKPNVPSATHYSRGNFLDLEKKLPNTPILPISPTGTLPLTPSLIVNNTKAALYVFSSLRSRHQNFMIPCKKYGPVFAV